LPVKDEKSVLTHSKAKKHDQKFCSPDFWHGGDWGDTKQQLADNSARNAIEGKFGQCKRRLGLGRVMARRRDCSETVISMTFLAANLIRWLWNTETFVPFLRFRPLFFMEREPLIMPFFQNAA
jgi:transposase, IS5 family, putative